MKRYIKSGIQFDSDNQQYTFDFTIDLPDDIIDIVPPKLYRSSIRETLIKSSHYAANMV